MKLERLTQPAAIADTIGGRISLAREALEMSAREAADQTDCATEDWKNWESDRCEPPPSMLREIASTLQVTLCWLLTGRGVGPTWEDLLDVVPAYRPQPGFLGLAR